MSSLAGLERLYTEEVVPRFRTWRLRTWEALGSSFENASVFSLWSSPFHGIDHYARVGGLALALHQRRREHEAQLAGKKIVGPPAPETVEALLLAAFFHDSGRVNEFRDPGHGVAGARIFAAFAKRASPSPSPTVRDVVSAAILYHCGGGYGSPDTVAAAIANADRLDRARFHEMPDPGQMCRDGGVWPGFVQCASGFVPLVPSSRARGDVGSYGAKP